MSKAYNFGDCHIHMILDGEDFKKAISIHRDNGPVDTIIRRNLEKYKNCGIDFLRDGGDSNNVCNRSKALASEYGIEYLTPGFPIHKKGHYGGFIGRSFSDMTEYRSLVKEAGNLGADFIKIMISGIMDFDHYGVLVGGELTESEIKEMIHIAHDEGFAVMAHCNGANNIKAALEAEVDSIEHGAYMDGECVEMMAQSDTIWVPTVSPIANLIGENLYNDNVLKEIVKLHITNINKVWSLGGIIALGTDAGAHSVPHAESVAREYNYLKSAIDDPELDAYLSMSKQQVQWRFKKK